MKISAMESLEHSSWSKIFCDSKTAQEEGSIHWELSEAKHFRFSFLVSRFARRCSFGREIKRTNREDFRTILPELSQSVQAQSHQVL